MNLREIITKQFDIARQEGLLKTPDSEHSSVSVSDAENTLAAVREHIKDMRLPLIDCGDEYCQPGCHKRQRNADLEAILEELEK